MQLAMVFYPSKLDLQKEFEEDYLITVRVSEQKTAYLAGMFYTLDEAEAYQKSMKKEGYTTSFIVAFRDGKKLEF